MNIQAVNGFKCIQCDWVSPVEPFHYTCPKCGKNLDITYDYELLMATWSKADLALDKEQSIWRFLPLLPVKNVPKNLSLRVGGTPLVNIPSIAKSHRIASFRIKDDSRNPSGSLKDRATEIAIQHAREMGKSSIVAASTGNAGSSLAALGAFHGLETIIFAPASAPPAKLTQILQHGARLIPVDANYDIAFDLAYLWAKKNNHYCRNTGINPILAEGKKTVALEIAEQLSWHAPDHVFVPVGDGCIISGIFKGFFDLLSMGWIDHLPRLHAVQAEGSAAIVKSLKRGGEIEAVTAHTLADSIRVDKPRDGDKALRAIRESSGTGFSVSDNEILAAQKNLSESTGIFAEPAAAAAYAGFLKASQLQFFKPDESVVILITGSGLKDIPSAQKSLESIFPVKAEMSAIDLYLEQSRKT